MTKTIMVSAAVVLMCCMGARGARQEQEWVQAMRTVHAKFTGKPGTFAQFGDSITVSMAYWAGLRWGAKGLNAQAQKAYELVKGYMLQDCWDKWKGGDYGSEGSMTIRWAHENVDPWLKSLNPEVVLIMFGTNDLNQLKLDEYQQKTRQVVQKCLNNGTVVILSTIPPRSGQLDKCRQFAEAVRKLATDMKVPVVDYLEEVLKRRPDDWDGTMPRFKDVPGDEYQVPTLISRDGVHPSNPKQYSGDYSQEALRCSGFGLRSYLTLTAYADVINEVLKGQQE